MGNLGKEDKSAVFIAHVILPRGVVPGQNTRWRRNHIDQSMRDQESRSNEDAAASDVTSQCSSGEGPAFRIYSGTR